MTSRGVLEYVAFQIVWLACALGAANGSNLPGVAAALAVVSVHIALSTSRSAAVTMVAMCGFVGFAAESLFAMTGVLRYAAAWPSTSVAPAWIVALWLAFAITLPATRWMLGERPLAKAAALGAVFGPAAYLAGDRIGALQMTTPVWHGLLLTAVVWALAFPTLVALSGRKSCAATKPSKSNEGPTGGPSRS